MRIAYFDPFSGASGDMILGALLDAGASLVRMQADIAKLNLGRIDIRAGGVSQHGLHGTRIDIDAPEDQPHRTWRDIKDIITTSTLSPTAKTNALAIFERLAVAEAAVHGVPSETVHFHEVGGIDAIVDICGAALLLEQLGVEAVYSGAPRVGQGTVRAAHGLLPIPAPATAELLAAARAPIAAPMPGGESVNAELLTPTGAAILTTLARFTTPEFVPSAVGYGFGVKELPWPNALRVIIGDLASIATPAPVPDSDGEIVMETNIDDMSPQHMELLVERLFAAGALDVWMTPIVMKKSRPATTVSLLAPEARRAALEEVMITNTTTLGVRVSHIERTKAARRIEQIETRWGTVRIKLRGWDGRVIDVNPEYDDCLAIARANEVTLREVWNEAHKLGEAFIGRRMNTGGDLVVFDPKR